MKILLQTLLKTPNYASEVYIFKIRCVFEGRLKAVKVSTWFLFIHFTEIIFGCLRSRFDGRWLRLPIGWTHCKVKINLIIFLRKLQEIILEELKKFFVGCRGIKDDCFLGKNNYRKLFILEKKLFWEKLEKISWQKNWQNYFGEKIILKNLEKIN